MIPDKLYSAWKKGRSQVDVDNRFADRVMERIGDREQPRHGREVVVPRRSPYRLAWRLQVAAAVFVLGLSIGLVRASSLILFLLLNTSRGY